MKKLLTSVIIIIMLLSVFCCLAACNKKAPFDQVVDCAKALKDIVNDESFEIAGEFGYKKNFEFEGSVYLYDYVVIQFKVKDQVEVAYFVDCKFVGFESDYDNGTYKQWSESRQERFLESSLIFLDDDYGYDYIYTKEDVITAAGFLSSGEVGSGAENAVA